MKLCDGKYEFKLVPGTHADFLICLRHGKEWRNLVGDNAVMALFNHAESLQKQVDDLTAKLSEANSR